MTETRTAADINQGIDRIAERDVSYSFARMCGRGTKLVAQRAIWYDGRITEAGDTITVLSLSNAGFNGITVFGKDKNGDYIQQSLGAFRPVTA
jgi:hypothetical protein